MVDAPRFQTVVIDGQRRARAAWRAAAAQPSWVTKLALLALVVLVGIPLFVLALVLALAAMIFVALLVGANLLLTKARSALPRRDGRENVRVIRRE